MAYYLIQVSYTPEAWATLVKSPHDRAEVVASAVQKLGGRMERFWMSFGEYDVIGVVEMPSNIAAAAFAMAVASGGACRNVKTTPLLSTQEGLEALQQAAGSGYKPVSATAAAS